MPVIRRKNPLPKSPWVRRTLKNRESERDMSQKSEEREREREREREGEREREEGGRECL